MNRRGFIAALTTGIAGLLARPGIAFDPERELWVPGEKTIFDMGASVEKFLKETYRITLPDGTTWTFQGIMTNLQLTAPLEGLMTYEVDVTPTGPLTIDSSRSEHRRPAIKEDYPYIAHGMRVEQLGPAECADLKVLTEARGIVQGTEFVNIAEIQVPRLEREPGFEIRDPKTEEVVEHVPGLKRMGNMHISGYFNLEIEEALNARRRRR